MYLKSEIEVTKIFVRYVQHSIIRRSFELYRKEKHDIKIIPYENWVIEKLLHYESPQMLEKMTFNDIWEMENFIDNDQLAIAVGSLNTRQKFILYWKYVEEASDARIGELLGISSQAVSKQKRKAIDSVVQFYFD